MWYDSGVQTLSYFYIVQSQILLKINLFKKYKKCFILFSYIFEMKELANYVIKSLHY